MRLVCRLSADGQARLQSAMELVCSSCSNESTATADCAALLATHLREAPADAYLLGNPDEMLDGSISEDQVE